MQTNQFAQDLNDYKKMIDADIETYVAQNTQRTQDVYGDYSALVANAYTEILQRGGKRIRGVLTLVGYEMCGGTDQEMIIKAARAIEMMHAYMLIIDDIQDRAATRRGGPSAHKLLEAVHAEKGWGGDAAHTGISLALNAALFGSHGAGLVLGTLDVADELRTKALNIMNNTMIVTAHGQTNDIINEIIPEVSSEQLENVLQWKTAHYTILNPIHMGMVLAGAPCEDTNGITQYAIHTGKAFQISDDLLIISSESGKDALDDIREGKQTILTVYALQNAPETDTAFLTNCLGNAELTQDEFERCKNILIQSGAVDYAKKVAQQHVSAARESLQEHAGRWTPRTVTFLDELTQHLADRNA